VSDAVPEARGGCAAAEVALARVAPETYVVSHNFLDGAVTRLSAYLRHGVLSLGQEASGRPNMRSGHCQ
jgi:deoxyribodipyrimidine photo-lyase